MKKQTPLFWTVTIATLAWIAVMQQNSPKNIIQFELARTVDAATEIISNWQSAGVALAQKSTYLDFVFLILYCGAISLSCKVASNFSGRKVLQKIGLALSRIVWLAGACDAIENIAMLKTLEEINQATISIAFYFAGMKFLVVIVALLFIVISTTAGLFTTWRNKEGGPQSNNP